MLKSLNKIIAKHQYVCWCFLFLVGILLYANTIGHGYVLDDAIVIEENEFTQQGIAGIWDLLSHDTFYGFFQEEGKSRLVSGGRYRPFTLITFAIEESLFDGEPKISHFINVVANGVLGVLVFIFVRLLFRSVKLSYAIALASTFVFIAHPLHTEVVANIKGRDEIFALLFSLLAIIILLKSPKNIKYAFAVSVSFMIALLSKESAIIFVLVLPLIHLVVKKYAVYKSILDAWPLYIPALLYIIVRTSILGWSSAPPSTELMNNPFIKVIDGSYLPFEIGEKVAAILYFVAKNIQLLSFPWELTHDYYPRYIGVIDMSSTMALLGCMISIGFIVLLVVSFMRRHILSVPLLIYLLPIILTSNIIFPVGTYFSERFLFIPSLGFAMALAWMVVKYAGRRPWLLGGMAFWLAILCFKTVERNRDWKSNYLLFSADIKKSMNSAKLNNGYAGELILKHQDHSKDSLELAVTHLEKALQIHPNYLNARLLLGNAKNYQSKSAESIEQYLRILSIDPNYDEALNNLAITYQKANKYSEAEDILKRLTALPKYSDNKREYFSNLYESAGLYYLDNGNREKGIYYLKMGLNEKVNMAKFGYFIGVAYAQDGNFALAADYFEKALTYKPDEENRRRIITTLEQVRSDSIK